jgi:hypothetical protein
LDHEVKTSKINNIKLIPISEHEFFINSHQNGGMQDLKITTYNTGLILTDGSVVFGKSLVSAAA